MKTLPFASTVVAFAFTAPIAIGAERPNIIVILADDMGFSDIGCYSARS